MSRELIRTALGGMTIIVVLSLTLADAVSRVSVVSTSRLALLLALAAALLGADMVSEYLPLELTVAPSNEESDPDEKSD